MTDTTAQHGFRPSRVSHPGDTIADALNAQGLSQIEAAQRLGVSKKFVNDLVRGRASIHKETALKLARVLGSSPEFWLRRQALYDAECERLESEQSLAAQYGDWLAMFRVSELVDRRWIEQRSTKGGKIEALLEFFGVVDPERWEEVYARRVVAFRTSPSFPNHVGPTTAWLRQGEKIAMRRETAQWEEAAFKALLPQLRALTRLDDFGAALVQLQDACASAGVVLALVAPLQKCHASGASFFQGSRAVLMLSGRHKTDDHFWFSFFHEAGHLVKHGSKGVFIEGLEGLDAEKEEEANRFAADVLVAPEHLKRVKALRTEREVTAFAESIGVAPGIVVGRMQHEGWIPRSHFNALKKRHSWNPGDGDA